MCSYAVKVEKWLPSDGLGYCNEPIIITCFFFCSTGKDRLEVSKKKKEDY